MYCNSIAPLQVESLSCRGRNLIVFIAGSVAGNLQAAHTVEEDLTILVMIELGTNLLHLFLCDIKRQLAAQPYILGVPHSVDHHVVEARHAKSSLASTPLTVIKIRSLPTLAGVSGSIFPHHRLHVGRGQHIVQLICIIVYHMTVGSIELIYIALHQAVVGHHAVELRLHISQLSIYGTRERVLYLFLEQPVGI